MILSVDPSSAWSGWALYDGRRLVRWGRVKGVLTADGARDAEGIVQDAILAAEGVRPTAEQRPLFGGKRER